MISTGKSSNANCPPILIVLHEEMGGGGENEGVMVTVDKASSHFDSLRPSTASADAETPHPLCSDPTTPSAHHHEHTSHPNAVETRRFYRQGE